jgi:sugar/nucleoside kinase (ribokinase family)
VDLIAASRHVHAGSTALQPALRSGLPALFRRSAEQGVTTSFDPNWDPAERWEGTDAILRAADICFPNLQEAQRLTGSADPVMAARELWRRAAAGRGTGRPPPIVVVKLGAEGALAARADELVRVAAPRVPVVDTTGAGDSFDAGFIAAHVSGWPLDEALTLAVTCGSATVQAAGGVDAQLTFAEAEALLRGRGSA